MRGGWNALELPAPSLLLSVTGLGEGAGPPVRESTCSKVLHGWAAAAPSWQPVCGGLCAMALVLSGCQGGEDTVRSAQLSSVRGAGACMMPRTAAPHPHGNGAQLWLPLPRGGRGSWAHTCLERSVSACFSGEDALVWCGPDSWGMQVNPGSRAPLLPLGSSLPLPRFRLGSSREGCVGSAPGAPSHPSGHHGRSRVRRGSQDARATRSQTLSAQRCPQGSYPGGRC